MAQKIRKGDRVMILAGRDRGREGDILKVFPKQNKAIVNGVNIVRRHRKPTQQAPGNIEDKEIAVDLSNLAVLDPGSGKSTRVGFQRLSNGCKVRVARFSGEVIDI